jgi:pimeloyl-ACP methyl ester carboxylesterase
VRAGWATVSIDRLGNGQSTHPASAAVNLDSNAAAVSELVRTLRFLGVATPRGDLRADRVVLVGHSLGSAVAALAAARYDDADALVLTGYTHGLRQAHTTAALALSAQPAAADPAFAGTGLDPGYLTTRPGARGFLYAPATGADPRAIERDEATKGTATTAEISGLPALQRTVLDGVTAPVLLVVGRLDGLFCSQVAGDGGADCTTGAALANGERPFFPRATAVDASVVPGAGHLLAAFDEAPGAFAAAQRWLAGPAAQAPGGRPCSTSRRVAPECVPAVLRPGR